jgi:hypothetical protein
MRLMPSAALAAAPVIVAAAASCAHPQFNGGPPVTMCGTVVFTGGDAAGQPGTDMPCLAPPSECPTD